MKRSPTRAPFRFCKTAHSCDAGSLSSACSRRCCCPAARPPAAGTASVPASDGADTRSPYPDRSSVLPSVPRTARQPDVQLFHYRRAIRLVEVRRSSGERPASAPDVVAVYFAQRFQYVPAFLGKIRVTSTNFRRPWARQLASSIARPAALAHSATAHRTSESAHATQSPVASALRPDSRRRACSR